MDIQVARFREVLGLLKPVIPRNPTLKVLTHVLIKDGKAVGTDMDTMVIVQVPEADIECLFPYTDVVKMLQYVQGLEYLHIEPRNGKVTMSWSDGSSTFSAGDPLDFPSLPEFVPTVEADIDIDTLIPAMYEALAFAATETSRPVLQGVTLVMGDEVAVAAGDGYRMAHKVLPLSFPQESINVVPAGSVNALKLLWDKTPRTPPASDSLIPIIVAKKQASVALDGKTGLRFVFGDSTTAIVKLVDGSPPDWLKLMPKKEPVLKASVMGSQLELAARRVLSVAMMGKKIVRLVFNDDSVTVSAKYDDQEIESTIEVLVSKGAPNKVGLDVSYLLEYLKGKEGLVTLSWESRGTPLLFNHQNTPTVLIMPMNVDWDEAKVEPAQEADGESVEEAEAEPVEEAEGEPVPVPGEEPVQEPEAEPVQEPEVKPAPKKRTRK